MAHIYYNQLRNARIKNLTLGLFLLSMNAVMLFIISERAAQGKQTSTFYALLFVAIIVAFVFGIALIPFCQVIESLDKSTCATFYKLGPLKFKYQTWGKVESVTLEQDVTKYYCVTMKAAGGQTLVIEKHATSELANIRLSEFKSLFE